MYFITYSVTGWIYEVIVYYFEFHEGFVNRGFLLGPYLPVYGLGGIIIIKLIGNATKEKIRIGKLNITPLIVFLIITVITTVLELVTSYIPGFFLWDYNCYDINFQGRIALASSIRFGIIGLCGLYIVQPLIRCMCLISERNNKKIYNAVILLIAAVFSTDLIFHIIFTFFV